MKKRNEISFTFWMNINDIFSFLFLRIDIPNLNIIIVMFIYF